MKLPSVVGEILAGVLLGNLALAWPALAPVRALLDSRALHLAGELGVLLLLFTVGLESDVVHLKKTGARALLVATVGVCMPFFLTLLGWRLGTVPDFLPDGASSFSVVVFIAATLTATSVGITARVLADAKRLATRTGQLILNAAVIDDVLGLLILAATAALVSRGVLSGGELAWIAGKAAAFFALFVGIGYLAMPRAKKLFFTKPRGVVAAIGVCVCLLYAWGAHAFGLAAVVGAFFAGLLLDDSSDKMRKTLGPFVKILSPVFFVLVGTQVRLEGFSGFGPVLALLGIALLGKMACAIVAGKDVDKVAVGIGMAPRGEVGLIFIATGRELGVLSDSLYATLVFVVLLSTLLPVIALGAWFGRKKLPA